MIGGASGVIFAVVVILWVAYVVPLMLRRYDEASKTSSLGSFSSLSRVIARPGRDRSDAGDEGSAHDSAPAVAETPAPEPAPVRTPVSTPRPADRASARLAARRRRRVLITLLVTLVVVAGLGLASVIGQVWTAVPSALLVAWLVACRIQVRGERGLSTPSLRLPSVRLPRVGSRSSSGAATSSRRGGTAADEETTLVVSHQFEDVEPNRPRIMEQEPLGVDALDEQLQIAVPSVATTGEALWDPLPVTLPTYVTKPRVGRTVRTIDFAQAGTWSSGHVEAEGVELPGQVDGAEDEAAHGHDTRKAVGH
ncbi:MAG: hypothetical protein P1U38_14250 [Aeromicrobium sp.]|uniref:divisome protein SepX/GlpR n=1 Tax=Aeromicrobium sp. TaxID=1871063 RepID=UPI0026162ECA|nr:hypothetical protein [Aeromicrobium sp.]MDF1705925.1 hypothetical protein [Aeromicrobium sp.]